MWSWLYGPKAQADACPVDHESMSADEIAAYTARHNLQSKTEKENGASASGCPVDHENMSKEEIAAFMAQHNANKKAANASAGAGQVPLDPPSACPVDHENMSKDQVAKHMARAASQGKSEGEKGKPATVYDVYGQEIDPANNMPAIPNQLPSPGQETRLPTERVSSTIPKSETDSTWTYPSPQMFYNALKRKGKADDVDERDMSNVVAIHNSMNEGTWAEVLDWERRFHCNECDNPKLRRFQGRPHDLSPAARFRSTFRGYPAPFDRHDWVVDRCGKEDVRYIIDYYYREHTQGDEDPIELHVRPALDSPGAAWDRVRARAHAFRSALFPGQADNGATVVARGTSTDAGKSAAPAAPNMSTPKAKEDAAVSEEEFEFLRTLTPENVEAISNDVKQGCAKIGLALAQSKADPEAYEKATVSLNYCMASKICKPEAAAFMTAMETANGSEPAAYSSMTSCLDRFHIMARRVMTQGEGIAQLGPEKT